MGKGWKYTPSHSGIGQYLQHEQILRQELHRRSLLGLAVAKALAQHGPTGEHAASGHVEDGGFNGGIHKDRMEFSIVFDSPHSVPVTYPRKHPEARHYLLAAINAMEGGT